MVQQQRDELQNLRTEARPAVDHNVRDEERALGTERRGSLIFYMYIILDLFYVCLK
jgi:hypothetical protein